MAKHITHDPIYNTLARDDFPAMIEVDRYGQRTDAFDGIIAATHDHFWDPMDKAYLDFDQPFDLENEYLLPPEIVPELNTAVRERLDERQQIKLANENARWSISSSFTNAWIATVSACRRVATGARPQRSTNAL